MKMKISSLKKSCYACPAQWEGQLADGRYVYIRYRWGWLGVGVGYTSDYEYGLDQAYAEQVGGDYDGFMDTKIMLTHLRKAGIRASLFLWIKAWIPRIRFENR